MQDKSGSYIWWHIPITLTLRKLSEADQLHSETVLITKGRGEKPKYLAPERK